MNKSKTLNKYYKWLSTENFLAMKRAKNYGNNPTKTAKKNYFRKVTKSRLANNKGF